MAATTTRRTRTIEAPKFEPRVRFNWGFHDAEWAAQRGHGPHTNYGFARGTMTITRPEDVTQQHYDPHYAAGWRRGWAAFEADGHRHDSSEPAWDQYIGAGCSDRDAA